MVFSVLLKRAKKKNNLKIIKVKIEKIFNLIFNLMFNLMFSLMFIQRQALFSVYVIYHPFESLHVLQVISLLSELMNK